MTDDDIQPEGAEPGEGGPPPANGRAPGAAGAPKPRPSASRPSVRSGLAHRRNPVLATAGDLAVTARRLVFRDKLALFLTLASVALAVTFFVLLGSIGPSSHGTELPISRVVSLAEHKQIATATLLDHDDRVEIALKPTTAGGAPAGTASGGTTATGTTTTTSTTEQLNTTSKNAPLATPAKLEYWAAYPVSGAQTQGLLQTLTRGGVVVSVDQQSGKAPRAILVQFLLPILLLVCLFALFMRIGADGGAGGIAAFSEFTGKGRKKGKGKTEAITFADVAGAGEAVAELREIRDYLNDPSRYLNVGAAAPKGVLLVGPRGPVRRCSPRPSRVRPTPPSSRCRALTSSSRSWVWVRRACATCSPRRARRRPRSSSSTSSMPPGASAAPVSGRATTSVSRRSTHCSWRWTASPATVAWS